MSLRVLSYNIRYGGVGREKPIADVIRACEPDVVVLQEATHPQVVERVGALCGMPHWGSVSGHSLGFLSRLQPSRHTWHRIRLAKRRYLELEIERPRVRIFGLHLSAVHSNVTEFRRAYEARALLGAIAARQQDFHLLTGDFNTLAPGEQLDLRKLPPRLRAFVWITGSKIRWVTIQMLLDAGYLDGYRIFHQHDDGFTFPTWDPHVRLDYAFVPSAQKARLSRCEVVRNAPALRDASDHFPLLFEIAGEP